LIFQSLQFLLVVRFLLSLLGFGLLFGRFQLGLALLFKAFRRALLGLCKSSKYFLVYSSSIVGFSLALVEIFQLKGKILGHGNFSEIVVRF